MRRALDEFIVAGIRTNIELHKALLVDPEVVGGTMTTRTVERITSRHGERHESKRPPPATT
jgi:acetyl-CoA carboxylase biotin carboxylase subunit